VESDQRTGIETDRLQTCVMSTTAAVSCIHDNRPKRFNKGCTEWPRAHRMCHRVEPCDKQTDGQTDRQTESTPVTIVCISCLTSPIFRFLSFKTVPDTKHYWGGLCCQQCYRSCLHYITLQLCNWRDSDDLVKKCMEHEVEGPRPRERQNWTKRMLWIVVNGEKC